MATTKTPFVATKAKAVRTGEDTVLAADVEATVAAAVADSGNAGDDAVPVISGTFVGEQDGSFKVLVSLGGATGVAKVKCYFKPTGGAYAQVGVEHTVTVNTNFALANGLNAKFANFGTDTNLTLNDFWTVAVTAETWGNIKLPFIGDDLALAGCHPLTAVWEKLGGKYTLSNAHVDTVEIVGSSGKLDTVQFLNNANATVDVKVVAVAIAA